MAFSFQTLSIPCGDNTSDASFRLWGGPISAAIAAVGLVQTADTGQVNWTTATRSTATNTVYAYEIWRFNDSLQSTKPIFLKLEYGTGPNDYRNPSMWCTVGTASNGTGTITADAAFPAALHSQRRLTSAANTTWYSGTRSGFWVSSDSAGSLSLAGWMAPPGSSNPSYAGLFLLIERTRDWDGTLNGQGALVSYGANVAQAVVSQTLVITNTSTIGQGNNFGGVPATAGHSLTPKSGMEPGGTMNVYPVFTGASPGLNAPSKHVVSAAIGEAPAYATFPLTLYGESGTFMALGANGFGWDSGASGSYTGAFRIA